MPLGSQRRSQAVEFVRLDGWGAGPRRIASSTEIDFGTAGGGFACLAQAAAQARVLESQDAQVVLTRWRGWRRSAVATPRLAVDWASYAVVQRHCESLAADAFHQSALRQSDAACYAPMIRSRGLPECSWRSSAASLPQPRYSVRRHGPEITQRAGCFQARDAQLFAAAAATAARHGHWERDLILGAKAAQRSPLWWIRSQPRRLSQRTLRVGYDAPVHRTPRCGDAAPTDAARSGQAAQAWDQGRRAWALARPRSRPSLRRRLLLRACAPRPCLLLRSSSTIHSGPTCLPTPSSRLPHANPRGTQPQPRSRHASQLSQDCCNMMPRNLHGWILTSTTRPSWH